MNGNGGLRGVEVINGGEEEATPLNGGSSPTVIYRVVLEELVSKHKSIAGAGVDAGAADMDRGGEDDSSRCSPSDREHNSTNGNRDPLVRPMPTVSTLHYRNDLHDGPGPMRRSPHRGLLERFRLGIDYFVKELLFILCEEDQQYDPV